METRLCLQQCPLNLVMLNCVFTVNCLTTLTSCSVVRKFPALHAIEAIVHNSLPVIPFKIEVTKKPPQNLFVVICVERG